MLTVDPAWQPSLVTGWNRIRLCARSRPRTGRPRASLGDYALVGCTVGPGFDFADFTILANDPPSIVHLLALDPELASLI